MSFMKATNNKIVKANNTTISLVTKTNEYEMDIARFKIEEPELYSKYRKESSTYSYLNIILMKLLIKNFLNFYQIMIL